MWPMRLTASTRHALETSALPVPGGFRERGDILRNGRQTRVAPVVVVGAAADLHGGDLLLLLPVAADAAAHRARVGQVAAHDRVHRSRRAAVSRGVGRGGRNVDGGGGYDR